MKAVCTVARKVWNSASLAPLTVVAEGRGKEKNFHEDYRSWKVLDLRVKELDAKVTSLVARIKTLENK